MGQWNGTIRIILIYKGIRGAGAEVHGWGQSVHGKGPRGGAERAERAADAKGKILLSSKPEPHFQGSRGSGGRPPSTLPPRFCIIFSIQSFV